jgi:hypothetical protein
MPDDETDIYTGQPVPDPTGEANSGTMPGEGPGTGGKPTQPKQPPQAPAIQPAKDATAPGAGATTTPQPATPTEGQQPNSGKAATQSDILQHTYQLQREAEAAQERATQYYRSMQDQIKAIGNEPYPEMPKLASYPQAPNSDDQKKKGARAMIAYALLAIPMMIMGGRKAGGYGAMQGFGEGLKALKEGNDSLANKKYQQWRELTEATHQQNTERLAQYKELMSARNTAIKDKIDAVKSLADTYKDTATVKAAEAADWEKLSDHLAKYEKLVNDTRTKVLGKINDINKLFGSKEGELYRSWGAEEYPELADGLYSNDPQKQAIAYEELRKHKSFWSWTKENYKYTHSGESGAEKEDENEGLNRPPGAQPPKTLAKPGAESDHIRELGEDLLGPLPKPGSGEPKEETPADTKMGSGFPNGDSFD